MNDEPDEMSSSCFRSRSTPKVSEASHFNVTLPNCPQYDQDLSLAPYLPKAPRPEAPRAETPTRPSSPKWPKFRFPWQKKRGVAPLQDSPSEKPAEAAKPKRRRPQTPFRRKKRDDTSS
ncbi:uncharacterized protein LOC106177507 [Lingula anatina]|uniref:Uncharacterized protein LOC106177507 n=1 Tax=Lingula anatina TaxID=7574 RepID=A0A1S3JZC4_LINAN|nr:uncharacterized protein LOC106177507 [Lingula anatina]|eukprot:XP_013415748.1 uncharacterized protein LOC106177507 [Lingula anatina]